LGVRRWQGARSVPPSCWLAATRGGHRDLTQLVRLLTGHLPGGEELPLCRPRYFGLPEQWGFGLYQASTDDYEDSILPTGSFTGTPEQALDCTCGLYLNDPTPSPTEPPKD
jgi:hypothetical protein